MATEAEVALLRKLVGDTADPPTYSDEELDAALELAAPCPPPLDADGFPDLYAARVADVYGVAALLWEDRALTEETAGTALPEPARVTSERSGDQSVSYGGAGKLVGTQPLTPAKMRAMAARLRKRSCNWSAARTILVDAPGGRRELPTRGGLYPSQIVN